MKLALSLIATFFLSAAHGEIVVNKIGNTTGIAEAEVYSVSISGAKPSVKAVANAVATRIRHGYYREGGVIENWSLERVSLAKALKNLSEEDGDFKGLSGRDRERIDTWVEDKMVNSTAYRMTVNASFYGADGVTVHYILLPTDDMDPILVVSYNRYAEE